MSSRGFDPTRLDVELFAAEGAELHGHWPLRGFKRICELAAEDRRPTDTDTVTWNARGERLPARGSEHATWLHLGAKTAVALQCQRCLAAVEVPLEVRRKFSFVPGEDAAAAIDATVEEDVLAMTRALDLRELIEDELLLAMPLVPRHEVCPVPLTAAVSEAIERPNPFAALAALKRQGPPG